MRYLFFISLFLLGVLLAWHLTPGQSDSDLINDDIDYLPVENLRDAMQERMSEMLRIRESIQEGKQPEIRPFTKFSGLPHSEFVDDVSEHQDFFKVFDEMYGQIFTSSDPRQQFNIVANSCAACHQTVCPGPLRSIRRLPVIADIGLVSPLD